MNAERLLAHFEQISEAPDAVARLRRFILDLAVRGKLVEQDPEDEPAEKQLERITMAKLSLGRKERAIRKKKSDTSIEPFHHVLPDGWVTAVLADLVAILNGRAYKQSELLESGTPVLRVGNLFTSNKWYYSDLELEDDKYCDDGDLIFAWSASFGPFIWSGGRVIYHYHIWKLPLHSPSDLSRDYLHLYLLQKTSEIKSAGHGISMVHMTKEKMEQLEVPLPPLAEQRRIVAKVDELMALCDQLEAARQEREQTRERLVAASLQRLNQPAEDPASFRQNAQFALEALPSLTTTPAQIKQLRQAILSLAVRGKLVEQDSEDEPAVTWLLQRLEDSSPGRTRKPRVKVIEEENDEALALLPESWLWVVLDDLIESMDSGWSPQCEDHPRSSMECWGVLKTTAVQSLSFDDRHHKKLPSKLQPRPQYEARQCDILVTRAGPKNRVGISCVVDKVEPRLMISDKIIRFRVADEINPRFVALALNTGRSGEAVEQAKTGMAVMQMNISQVKLRAVPIPLPPLAEQHRIVARVDELMALCDQLEQQLSQAGQQRRRLLEAVLAKAFQDPEGALEVVYA